MLQISHTEAEALEQVLQLVAVQVVVAVVDLSAHNYSVKQSVLDTPVISV